MAEDFGYVQFPPGTSLEDTKRFREKFEGLMVQSGAKLVPFKQQQPPALFSPNQLEQIRVVVREELQEAMKPPVLEGDVPTSEEIIEHLKQWKPVIQVKPLSVSLPAVKYLEYEPECDEAIEGHPSITAELEHQGKLYKGILYFVKDVE